MAIGLAALAVYVLAVVGFHQYFERKGEPSTLLDELYFGYVLFFRHEGGVSGEVPWALQAARFLAPLVVGTAAVTAVAAGFARGLDVTRARMARGHTVVCGLSRKGFDAAVELARTGRRVVAIERDDRHELLPLARQAGLTVLIGDAAHPDTLALARVDRARRLLAVTSDDNVNLAIAAASKPLAATKPGVLTCYIHLSNPRLWRRVRDLEPSWCEPSSFVAEGINVYERAAHAVVSHLRLAEALASSKPTVMIVADGVFGDFVLRRLTHPPEAPERAPAPGARAYVVGPDAALRAADTRETHAPLGTRIRVVPVDGDPSEIIDDQGHSLAGLPSPDAVHTACICMDDGRAALTPALAAFEYLRASGAARVVLCRLGDPGGSGAADLACEDTHGRRLETLDVVTLMAESGGLFSGQIERLAAEIHARYREGQRASPHGKSEADPSMRPWADLPEELKDQNRGQAAHLERKLGLIGCEMVPLGIASGQRVTRFSAAEVELLAEAEHERWMAMKRRTGYGKWHGMGGSTHPDMVPWRELPEGEQDKDRSAVEAVPELLEKAGFAAIRVGSPPTR